MSVRIKNRSVSDNWMKERNLPCLLQRISFYHVIFNTYRYIHTNFSFLQLWAIPDSMNTITSCIQSSENNDMPYIVEIFQMKWTLKLLRTISFTSIYYRDGFYSPRVCWGCELKQYTTTVFTWLFVGNLNVSENLSKIGILQTEPLNHLEINRHYRFIFV